MCPHAVFAPGTQITTVDVAGRNLVPGVEPGGSRAGEETKPALLIRDARLIVRDMRDTGTTVEVQNMEVYLKLSQETDLTPGLILPVGGMRATKTGTASEYNDIKVYQSFTAQGTVWAPRMVGLRIVAAQGTPTNFSAEVDLDYERVEVPWMDWFIMWDYLDNVVDNDREY